MCLFWFLILLGGFTMIFDSASRALLEERFLCDASFSAIIGVGFTWFVPCIDKTITSLALTLQIEKSGFMNILLRGKGIEGEPVVSVTRLEKISVIDVSSIYLLWLRLVGDVEFKESNEDVTTFRELVDVVAIMNKLIMSVNSDY
jgi:hypothetical protein